MNDESEMKIFGFEDPHWFEERAVDFRLTMWGRRPATVREWSLCVWNADLFVNGVPYLKCLTIAALLISWLT